MFLWISIAIALASIFVVRHLWRSYSHPYNTLVRQSAKMNWVVVGTMKYSDGFQNIRLRRGDLLAEVSFKDMNVRLLQPDVKRPFKDFVDLEQWLGAVNSATDKLHALPKAAGSTTQKNEVEYFDKIDNLLAAKGARDDFTALQGWDKEFGTASVRVCAMAELANESPVVVAAFMLESMEYYHKHRDVALSYLPASNQDIEPRLKIQIWQRQSTLRQKTRTRQRTSLSALKPTRIRAGESTSDR